MKKRDKNDKIYKIRGSGHPGVVVEKRHRRYTTVPMSTKPTDQSRKNIPMEKNVNPNDPRKSYFMTDVREYKKKQLGKRFKGAKLSKNDKATAKTLVKRHRKRQKAEQLAKKSKRSFFLRRRKK